MIPCSVFEEAVVGNQTDDDDFSTTKSPMITFSTMRIDPIGLATARPPATQVVFTLFILNTSYFATTAKENNTLYAEKPTGTSFVRGDKMFNFFDL